ncbi:MAG: elongation factor P maturation arginine rhamnosyltransferase EarP [Patescibacteria group bacterium]
MQMDFTVPIIDNFGDMGFALSLAVSMMEKHPDLTIRFWSEDEALFERMLAEKAFPRLSYHVLSDWSTSDHSEIRCNFFGLKLIESELQATYPHMILNFDYLQFHKDRGL